MKIMFTSSGLVTQDLVDKAIELCGKPAEEISVAIINEASKVEFGDKRWVIRHFNDLDTFFGGVIEVVDLQALSIEETLEKISQSDLIYVLGGDADYLLDVYNKSRLSQHLAEILENKVYIGCSAGSMVLGQRTTDEVYSGLFGERSRVKIDEFLNFVDYIILPHKDDEKFPNVTKENIDRCLDLENNRYFAIQREQALVINDGKIEFVGGTPYGF